MSALSKMSGASPPWKPGGQYRTCPLPMLPVLSPPPLKWLINPAALAEDANNRPRPRLVPHHSPPLVLRQRLPGRNPVPALELPPQAK